MPISNYGVWKGTPTSFTAQTLEQDRSPHITLKFSDGSSKGKQAAINVASTDSDSRLVYWLQRQWNHPITTSLTPLADGFHKATGTDGTGAELSLDYIRTTPPLLDLSAGLVLQDTTPGSGDILDQLEPILNDAISAQASIYIFGSSYGTGIHDIHMNQGSAPTYENAVGQDGALIFHYNDGHFEAVFLAFASQSIPTDDQTGAAESGGQTLGTIAVGTAAGSGSGGSGTTRGGTSGSGNDGTSGDGSSGMSGSGNGGMTGGDNSGTSGNGGAGN
ncbi:hypothetical protein LTR62_004777 [Meristemomyces frigidus]|uniref:Uncharacterized protein n=1 Tax=Meristemomyces frigidus TaxID=1508187 RepID=A0AAN7YJQ2_9PEZI|nr:hypothetical protein LTR62_004777 [Meristemomyces frigidus]